LAQQLIPHTVAALYLLTQSGLFSSDSQQTLVDFTDDGSAEAEEDKKVVIIYVRVSSEEQDKEGRSIKSQTDELTSIVENSPEIVKYADTIKERGETGTDFDREGIQEVVRLAKNDEVTHIMVDTLDRIGRIAPPTLSYIYELRERYGVKLMTRNRELDINKPTDRMQVVMLALMADLGTMNRARSSLRSSADNFLDERKWSSWFTHPPIGYKMSDEWIAPIDELRPVIEDTYTRFFRTENYSKTASKINEMHGETLSAHSDKYSDKFDGELSYHQVKAIVSRPVYKGEPTIPITDFEHYESNPSVTDPDLRMVSDEKHSKAEEIVQEIAEKYSTDEGSLCSPEEYADEFNPYMLESISSPVRLVCPECESDLAANGQHDLTGDRLSRRYKCKNDDCDYTNRWPGASEHEMMELFANLDDLHSL
jgi:DNA invertase Pin-like site-specific DNA recombinase